MNIEAGLMALLWLFLVIGIGFSAGFGYMLLQYTCEGYPTKKVAIAFSISVIVFLTSLFFYNALK
jgi:hypothetical protein